MCGLAFKYFKTKIMLSILNKMEFIEKWYDGISHHIRDWLNVPILLLQIVVYTAMAWVLRIIPYVKVTPRLLKEFLVAWSIHYLECIKEWLEDTFTVAKKKVRLLNKKFNLKLNSFLISIKTAYRSPAKSSKAFYRYARNQARKAGHFIIKVIKFYL